LLYSALCAHIKGRESPYKLVTVYTFHIILKLDLQFLAFRNLPHQEFVFKIFGVIK
jgi:hypothetical protein